MEINSDFFNRIFSDKLTPVFYCDDKFIVTAVNECFSALQPKILVGCKLCDISQENIKNIKQAQSELAKKKVYFSTKFDLFEENYTIIIFPQANNSGNFNKLLCIIVKNEDYPDFAPSHETFKIVDRYRTPINNILVLSDTIASKCETAGDETLKKYLNQIMKSCFSMLRVTAAVHDYQSLISQTKRLDKKPLIINSVITKLQNALKPIFKDKPFNIKYDLPDNEIISIADEEMLLLALYHIVSNSCYFCDDSVNITILLKRDGRNGYSFTVSDNGIGIDNAIASLVCEPFFTTRTSGFTEDSQGLGLGLSIAKAIVKKHDGDLSIISSPHGGTAVTLRMPIVDTDGASLSSPTRQYNLENSRLSVANIIFSDVCDIDFC